MKTFYQHRSDADPWGKIMVFRKDVGWTVIQLHDVVQFITMKHTHWTYTPSFLTTNLSQNND